MRKALAIDEGEGASAERARIVEWLRRFAARLPDSEAAWFADRIEEGEPAADEAAIARMKARGEA